MALDEHRARVSKTADLQLASLSRLDRCYFGQ